MDRRVRALQIGVAVGAVLFVGAIVTWITHLIVTAWRLGDVPSASIGISLVAIPVFLTLLGVIVYVFWGLLGERSGRSPHRPRGQTDTDGRDSASGRGGVIALVVALAALEGGPVFAGHESLSALLPGNPLEGSRLFAVKGCPGCHSVHGVGGVAGPDFGRSNLNRPLLELAGVMWNHAPGMEHVFEERRIARPTLTTPEMASLLTFLYYVGSLDPPGDAEAGGRLFREKGCQTCHALGGQGGRVGPALDGYSRFASPLYLTASLWNRGPAMAEEMQKRRIERPTLAGNDIANLLAYIRSAGGSGERVYIAPGSPKRGEALFKTKGCIACHAVRGHGGTGGPDLAARIKGGLMRIAGAMWNHAPHMWPKMAERGIRMPSLSPEEMADLVSYLYYFQFIDLPGDGGRGLIVFREKGCGACHDSPTAATPPPAASSDRLGAFESPLDVVTQMWNHAGKMEGKMAEANVAWPLLKGGETSDLVAYLLSRRQAPRAPAAKK